MNLNQRLDLIKPKILSNDFRKGRGLGNEINFWIFDYDAEDEMAIRSHIDHLKQTINTDNRGVRIVHFDLYEMMLDVLREKNYLEKVKQMENKKKSDAVIGPIKKTLRSTLADDIIINKISEGNNPDTDIIILSGVGKAWPVIRSHTILNNLHSKINITPLIMFFPGIYEGELKLFGEITDDNYYRAFKLIER